MREPGIEVRMRMKAAQRRGGSHRRELTRRELGARDIPGVERGAPKLLALAAVHVRVEIRLTTAPGWSSM